LTVVFYEIWVWHAIHRSFFIYFDFESLI